MKKFLSRLLTLILVFSLAGCNPDVCIDADDFGFLKLDVSSRYDKSVLSSINQATQVAPWVNSEYSLNGKPLVMMVRTWEYGIEPNNANYVSAWCPWFGSDGYANKLAPICVRLRECQFISDQMCTTDKDAPIFNAPCLLKNGIGLYALITTSDYDPNISYVSSRNPDGISMHLGEKDRPYKFYDYGADGSVREAAGVIYNYDGIAGVNPADAKVQYASGKLYFKILDKFYDDNSGQYRIVIKSGVGNDTDDPVAFLTKLVKDNLFGVSGDYGLVRQMYLGVVSNTGYQTTVKALLALYIMFTAFSFLTGNLQITHTELIARVIKVAIISALLSSKYAWTFFNDYLFAYFIGGVEQFINIIQNAATTGSGSSSLIGLMIAPQTMAKLFSLLFVHWGGFIYIILFFIALYFVFMMYLQATIIYLTALIAIGMMIIMGPIFLCFMLFDITRSLFENWLRQLISYSFQPLILFTGLAFIALIIRTELYSSLGFRVCKYNIPNLGKSSELFGEITSEVGEAAGINLDLGNSIFYWWFPKPMKGEYFTRTKAVIPVPIDHKDANGAYCQAYECMEERFIELPYLDPAKDQRLINSFFQGEFVHFDSLLLIFVSIYLLSKFNGLAVSVAQFLTGTTANIASAADAGGAAFKGITDASGKLFDRTPLGKGITSARKTIDTKLDKLSTKASTRYSNFMTSRLEKDALSGSANSAVLGEVKRNTGLTQGDIDTKALEKYKELLKANLTDDATNNNRSKDELKKDPDNKALIEKLVNTKFERLNDALAQAKYGKTHEELNPTQKGNIEKLFEGIKENPKALSIKAKDAQEFQKAYVEAHQAMSKRGIGVLGKNISGLRSLEELDNSAQTKRAAEKAATKRRGEGLYAGYEGVKRDLLTVVLGKENVSKMEGKLSGAAWHDFDYKDPRLRTYTEALRDQQKRADYDKLNEQINAERDKAKEDVLRPEYIAKLRSEGKTIMADKYSYAAKQKLKYEVEAALAEGDNPVLMGEKFMKEKATDSQSREMIEKAMNLQKDIETNDRYLRQEDKYEEMYDKAEKTLKANYNMVGGGDIKAEELPLLVEKYYDDQSLSSEAKKEKVEEVKSALEQYKQTQSLLGEMDVRKSNIAEEIQSHIDHINEQREASGMKKVEVELKIPENRRLRKIDDYLRSKS